MSSYNHTIRYYLKAAALVGAVTVLPGCVELASPRVSTQTIDSKASSQTAVGQEKDTDQKKQDDAAKKALQAPWMGIY